MINARNAILHMKMNFLSIEQRPLNFPAKNVISRSFDAIAQLRIVEPKQKLSTPMSLLMDIE